MEVEVCAYDDKSKAVQLPSGIEDVAMTIMRLSHEPVNINKWHLTHNNSTWVLKPDSSCGIEICSPVMRGFYGVRRVAQLIEALRTNPRVHVDCRCGFHVHFDVSDLEVEEVGTVLAWWIKAETVFLDAMPVARKKNRYCQQIGVSSLFNSDSECAANDIIHKLGWHKYHTANTYHYVNGHRETIEFRVAEDAMCLNPDDAKNWICLLMHFIDRSLSKGMPPEYRNNNQWTGLCWLDFKDLMNLLGFEGEVAQPLADARSWFIRRLRKNMKTNMKGVWSPEVRCVSLQQLERYVNSENLVKA